MYVLMQETFVCLILPCSPPPPSIPLRFLCELWDDRSSPCLSLIGPCIKFIITAISQPLRRFLKYKKKEEKKKKKKKESLESCGNSRLVLVNMLETVELHCGPTSNISTVHSRGRVVYEEGLGGGDVGGEGRLKKTPCSCTTQACCSPLPLSPRPMW